MRFVSKAIPPGWLLFLEDPLKKQYHFFTKATAAQHHPEDKWSQDKELVKKSVRNINTTIFRIILIPQSMAKLQGNF